MLKNLSAVLGKLLAAQRERRLWLWRTGELDRVEGYADEHGLGPGERALVEDEVVNRLFVEPAPHVDVLALAERALQAQRAENLRLANSPPIEVDVILEADWPDDWRRERRLLAAFCPETFKWFHEQRPSSVRRMWDSSIRAIGFSDSFGALLDRKQDATRYKRLDHVDIGRIDEINHCRASSGKLEEIENILSDRFPDLDSQLSLRLLLTSAAFDHLIAMMEAHRPRDKDWRLWLCVGVICPEFELPNPRQMASGRPDAFRRDLPTGRLSFELGIERGGSACEDPAEIKSVARWMSLEGDERNEPEPPGKRGKPAASG